MRRIGTTVVAMALALGGVAAAQQPAAAQVRFIHDKAGDSKGGFGDIKRVRIGHAAKWVYLRATPHKGSFLGDFDDYWIDTVKRNPGPEYVVTTDTDYGNWFQVRRSKRFGHYGKVVCEGKVHLVPKTREYRFRVKRACLGKPARLRVSAHTIDGSGDPRFGDWAPGKKRFGPWVKRL